MNKLEQSSGNCGGKKRFYLIQNKAKLTKVQSCRTKTLKIKLTYFLIASRSWVLLKLATASFLCLLKADTRITLDQILYKPSNQQITSHKILVVDLSPRALLLCLLARLLLVWFSNPCVFAWPAVPSVPHGLPPGGGGHLWRWHRAGWGGVRRWQRGGDRWLHKWVTAQQEGLLPAREGALVVPQGTLLVWGRTCVVCGSSAGLGKGRHDGENWGFHACGWHTPHRIEVATALLYILAESETLYFGGQLAAG